MTLQVTQQKAYSQAYKVRDKVYNGFENLPASFQRMNTYLQNYPGDDNITNASVSLVLATFKAIESAVAFNTSDQGNAYPRVAPRPVLEHGVTDMMLQPNEPVLLCLQAQSTSENYFKV